MNVGATIGRPLSANDRLYRTNANSPLPCHCEERSDTMIRFLLNFY